MAGAASTPGRSPLIRLADITKTYGEGERAYLWFLLLVMLGDIASNRLNPDKPLTIH